MLYTVGEGKFAADFVFPEALVAGEGSYERRERELAARYGHLPVIYPPPEDKIFRDLDTNDLMDQ
jgi:hypothetical protein